VRVMELRDQPCNIRAAFVAAPGWVILDADYNQIELRVMAHASQDVQLMAAFGSACGEMCSGPWAPSGSRSQRMR
jgi:hypothetical protein